METTETLETSVPTETTETLETSVPTETSVVPQGNLSGEQVSSPPNLAPSLRSGPSRFLYTRKDTEPS